MYTTLQFSRETLYTHHVHKSRTFMPHRGHKMRIQYFRLQNNIRIAKAKAKVNAVKTPCFKSKLRKCYKHWSHKTLRINTALPLPLKCILYYNKTVGVTSQFLCFGKINSMPCKSTSVYNI